MSLIKFKVIGEQPVLPSIIRLEIGKKFFIWKVKNLQQSLFTMAKDLESKIKNGAKSGELFYELVGYMRKNRAYNISIITLFETESVQELLDFETIELKKYPKDPDCLNISFLPYYPKWAKEVLELSINEVTVTVKSEESIEIKPVEKTKVKKVIAPPAIKIKTPEPEKQSVIEKEEVNILKPGSINIAGLKDFLNKKK